jgi:hypothetical protein
MNRATLMVTVPVLCFFAAALAGCPNKTKTDGAPAASASAAPSTAPATAAAPPADTAQDPAAVAANTPPASPDLPSDPNAAPSHDDHDKQAAAQIHTGNYKGELDKLEKEDLNADKN